MITDTYRTDLGRVQDPTGLSSRLTARARGLQIEAMQAGSVVPAEYYALSTDPVTRYVVPGLLAVGYLVGVGAVVWLFRRHPTWVPAPRRLLAPVLGTVVAWGATTATQTITLKYSSEIRVAGQVYLYHVVGLGCLAVLVALAVAVGSGRWRGPLAAGLRTTAALLLGVLVLVQLTLAWHLSDFLRGAFDGNLALTAAAVDGSLTQDARCAVLVRWADRPWPDYYRTAVVKDVQRTYQVRFGQPFCAGSAELQRVLGKATS